MTTIAKRKQRDQRRRTRGAAAVEMAVCLPVIVLFVLGIVEFGRALMVQQLVTNCAREGARQSIIDGSSNVNITQTVKDLAAETVNIDPSKFSVTIAVNGASGTDVATAQAGDVCSVSVGVPFGDVRFLPAGFLGGQTLVGRSSMHHE